MSGAQNFTFLSVKSQLTDVSCIIKHGVMICILQQKKRQKTLAKIKQLAEEEDSNTRAVGQKGKCKGGSRNRNQTKGGKDTPAKKKSSQKRAKQSAAVTNCNILPYFTVKK